MVVALPLLTILDVGHGNSAVLQDENGVVLIDAGTRNSVLEYLLERQIKRIDFILISHADKDHLEGLVALLGVKEVEIGKVRVNTDSSKKSALWDDVLYDLNQRRENGEIDFEPVLTSTDAIYKSGPIQLDVLAPSSYLAGKGAGSEDRQGRPLTSNSVSAVVRITQDGVPVALFPGDLDYIGLANLIESGKGFEAPILIFPHHGGKAGTPDLAAFAAELTARVKPEVVIFSIGRNKHLNPRPEIVDAIRNARSEVWIACTQLSKHCSATLPSESPPHLVNGFAKGKEGRQCCAGTIVVPLQHEKNMLPVFSGHQSFISANAPRALCRGWHMPNSDAND
jgi:beta-lactamase superfamily II metal-dependent hydrolase